LECIAYGQAVNELQTAVFSATGYRYQLHVMASARYEDVPYVCCCSLLTCSCTRVTVVGSNNTLTCCLARLPPCYKSAPCIFNSSHVKYPPLSGVEVKERVRVFFTPPARRLGRLQGELHLLP